MVRGVNGGWGGDSGRVLEGKEEKRRVKGAKCCVQREERRARLGRRRVNERGRLLHRRGQGFPNGKTRGKRLRVVVPVKKKQKSEEIERQKCFNILSCQGSNLRTSFGFSVGENKNSTLGLTHRKQKDSENPLKR